MGKYNKPTVVQQVAQGVRAIATAPVVDLSTPQKFIAHAIVSLRKDGNLGIHTKYSGFNDAYAKHFGLPFSTKVAEDETHPTIQAIATECEKGGFYSRPCKGGYLLYLPEDRAKVEWESRDARADKTLAKLLTVAKA